MCFSVADGTQAVAHAVLGDHAPGNGGGPLQVVGGAGGDVSQHQFLGHSAAQEGGDAVGELPLGLVHLVLLRQGDGHAAGSPSGDDDPPMAQ